MLSIIPERIFQINFDICYINHRKSFSIPTFKNYTKLAIEYQAIKDKRSVSVCSFNIGIFPISFSNAKWIWISSENLIELYLYVKIYLDYFPGRLK